MDQSTCPCGAVIEQPCGRGRRRKRCRECSPSRTGYQPTPRRNRECSHCQSPFLGNGNSRYCGDTCKSRAAYAKRNRLPCRICGKPTGWATTDQRAPTQPKHDTCLPEHGISRYHRGCRCDTCRQSRRDEASTYWATRRETNPPHLRCTTPGCERPRKSRGMCVKHAKRQARADGTWKPSPADAWNHPKRMARAKARYAIARGATGPAERFTVDDLLKRDGRTCGICRGPIPNVSHPDPRSPSIDHIQPLSLGGSHTLANTRPTHLRCNIARGNRD